MRRDQRTRSCSFVDLHAASCTKALCYTIPVLLSLLFTATAREQQSSSGVETTTADRLQASGWWPTKGVAAQSEFAGQAACVECHASQAGSQSATPMESAAQRSPAITVLRDHAALKLVNGPHTFSVTTGANGSSYSITDGSETLTVPVSWAFGSDQLGQTYLYQEGDRWYESQVSFFANSQALDLTAGHAFHPDGTLHDELGKPLAAQDLQRCFQCHTTFASSAGRFQLQQAIGGIQCEMCHGPARAHVTGMRAPDKGASTPHTSMLDLGAMSPVDSVDFCGACHRTWADVAFSAETSRAPDILRFQPYRLEKSKCWGANGDARITCVACHDPHKPLNRDDAVYDRQCLSCHSPENRAASHLHPADVKICPKSVKKCTSCHMPRYTVASMHGTFTDHMIRIVKPGEVFPM